MKKPEHIAITLRRLLERYRIHRTARGYRLVPLDPPRMTRRRR